MAKGEAKKVNKGINDERNRLNAEHQRLDTQLYSRLPGAQQRNQQGWDAAFGGFQGILDDPMFNGGGGGANFGEYENLFKNFAKTGGLSAENIARIRGNGGFDEFAKTGGYSDKDVANIRSRNAAQIPAFYQAIRNKLEQQNKISGGNAAYGASEARIARDQSREGARANLEGEIGLKDRINEGRRWGIGGMSSAEQALSELLSRNKLSGMSGALQAAGMGADDATRRMDISARSRLGAAEGLRGLRTDVPGEEFGLYDLIQRNAGQRGGLAGNNLNTYAGYNPNKGFMDYFKDFAGAIPALAAPFTGGTSAMFSGLSNPFKKKNQRVQTMPTGRNYSYLTG